MEVPIRPLVPIRVPIPYLEGTLVEEQSKIEPGIKSIKRTLTLTLTVRTSFNFNQVGRYGFFCELQLHVVI